MNKLTDREMYEAIKGCLGRCLEVDPASDDGERITEFIQRRRPPVERLFHMHVDSSSWSVSHDRDVALAERAAALVVDSVAIRVGWRLQWSLEVGVLLADLLLQKNGIVLEGVAGKLSTLRDDVANGSVDTDELAVIVLDLITSAA